MPKNSGFEREVLTRLEYIKEAQQKHDELFKEVYCKISKQKEEIDTAKGFAKGAMIMGGTGLIGGLLQFFNKFFK